MTEALHLIVGFGGFNAAGRSSSHQAFRRMVLESLPVDEQNKTIASLACLMGFVKAEGEEFSDADNRGLSLSKVVEQYRTAVIEGTLVRKIEHFDPSQIPGNKKIDFDNLKIKPRDNVFVEMQCISNTCYIYYNSLDQQSGAGPGGGTAPSNPPSNIVGGALGIFSAHTVQRKTVTIR